MPLTPREELLYEHLADLYRPATAIAAAKPGPRMYTLAYSSVRCWFEIKNSPSVAMPIGRVESDIVFAIDNIHFAEDQEIDDTWWIKNVSVLPDGTSSILFGRWWIVRSEPQRFISTSRRHGGRNIVMASQESRPPLGLS